MFHPDDLRLPIIQAPMAGGPGTTALAAAVCRAGGLGFVAAGYQAPERLAAQIAELRTLTGAPFGVNVFVPQPAVDPHRIDAYRAELATEAERHGVRLPDPDPHDTDHWEAKTRMLLDDPVPVVSFTFGTPPRDLVDRLRQAGTWVVTTVTSVHEARSAASLGVDALCVQGPEAGGHRGTFDPYAEPGTTSLLHLLDAIRQVTDLPLIAAGGMTTGSGIAAALEHGARAVQLGTAYLRTPEAGTHPAWRAALADESFSATVVTRAFSGRPARGLKNRFINAHHATAPVGYPLVNQLTKPLRAAAAARGDAHGLSLWAGTGYRDAAEAPAETLTIRLWQDARRAQGTPDRTTAPPQVP